MALIKCPECGKNISDKAVRCPKCGFPLDEINAATQESSIGDASLPQPPKEKKRMPTWLLVLIILCSALLIGGIVFLCFNGKSEEPAAPVITITDDNPSEIPEIDSVSEAVADTTPIRGQHRDLIIKSIVNGDKETFASLVQYPLYRQYPLRPIKNRQQMIDNFDLIFDAQFRNTLRTLDSNSWRVVGWRGAILHNGEIWGDGPVTKIGYFSLKEQQFRQKVIAAEMRALHPSLQGNWEPENRMLFDDKTYGFARIDHLQGDDYYRLTIFKKGAKIGDIPVLTLYGTREIQGSMGILFYSFSNDEGYEADFLDYDEPLSLTLPDGNNLSIKIKKIPYYQPNPLYP